MELGLCAVILAIFQFTDVAGIRCYVCNNIDRPGDCTRIGECADTQQCHVRRFTNTLGFHMFDLGCETNTFCNFANLGRREAKWRRQSIVVKWNKCCNDSYCNINYDEDGNFIKSVQPRRCFNCEFVQDPAMCDRVTTCSANDICFTHEKRNSFGMKGFGLTCKSREICADLYLEQLRENGITRGDLCQGCCDTSSLCSDHICSQILDNSTVPIYTPLLTTTTPTPFLVITNGPSNITTVPGTTVDFICDVDGYPNVTVTWHFPNIRNVDVVKTAERETHIGSKVTVKKVTESNVGEYICVGSTTTANISATASLTFIEFLNVTMYPSHMYVREGSMAKLSCLISGYPTPNVTWYFKHDENSAETVMTTGITTSGTGSQLQINHVTSKDGGTYTCNVTSSSGHEERSIQLDIEYKPVVNVWPQFQKVGLSERTELHCNATGHPTPTLSWEFVSDKGESVMPLVQVSLDRTRLVIRGMSEANVGHYTCIATNTAGQASATGQLTI